MTEILKSGMCFKVVITSFFQYVGRAIVQTMADAVVHRPSLVADIAGAPLPVMVDAEAGNLQATLSDNNYVIVVF